jgi:hypothetical protein
MEGLLFWQENVGIHKDAINDIPTDWAKPLEIRLIASAAHFNLAKDRVQ